MVIKNFYPLLMNSGPLTPLDDVLIRRQGYPEVSLYRLLQNFPKKNIKVEEGAAR